jgi:hypothetical protein
VWIVALLVFVMLRGRTAARAGLVATLGAIFRVVIVAACVRGCLSRSFLAFILRVCVICVPHEAAPRKSAKIEGCKTSQNPFSTNYR